MSHPAEPSRLYAEMARSPWPVALLLDLTEACDLRCRMCHYWGERGLFTTAGVATVPANLRAACSPPTPLSVLFMNGTEDPLVPFAGGTVDSDVGGEILSFDDAVAHWVAHDRCDPSPTTRHLDAHDDGTAIDHARYSDCAGGTRVEAYAVVGGGHTWPGGAQYLPEGSVGRVSDELEGTEAIWDFLLTGRRAATFE